MDPQAPDVTAVIVAYNSAESIRETVKSIESATSHIDAEILIVDNASVDDTSHHAEAELKRGRVIRLGENVGYGPGVNAGAQLARGRRLLIMNDDVIVDRSCIDSLTRRLDAAPDIGMVGARMVKLDGSESPSSRRQLPGWRDERDRLAARLARRDRRVVTGESPTVEVELLLAACVMVDTERFRSMGGFNQVFFLYGEDIDFCRRLAAAGLRRVLVRDAVAVHNRAVARGRRPGTREFMDRMLMTRDRYYRIWLSRPSRMLLNAYRAFGWADQPARFRFHARRAIYDGPTLRHLRTPSPLDFTPDSDQPSLA